MKLLLVVHGPATVDAKTLRGHEPVAQGEVCPNLAVLEGGQLCKKLEEVDFPPPHFCHPHPCPCTAYLACFPCIYEIPSTLVFLIKKHVLPPTRPFGPGLLSNQPCPRPTRAIRVSIPARLALSSMYRYPQRTQGASCTRLARNGNVCLIFFSRSCCPQRSRTRTANSSSMKSRSWKGAGAPIGIVSSIYDI